MKVYLIGYMGSGKSTVGKQLAREMKLDFIDFDRHIEEETGKTITELFDTQGEESFRELEHEHLKKLLPRNNVVVSLGGGTPCFYDNMELINKNGISVYLEVDADTLAKRLLKAKSKRPLIRDLNDTELKSFISANLEKRSPVYKMAMISVPAGILRPEELANKIMRRISDHPLG